LLIATIVASVFLWPSAATPVVPAQTAQEPQTQTSPPPTAPEQNKPDQPPSTAAPATPTQANPCPQAEPGSNTATSTCKTETTPKKKKKKRKPAPPPPADASGKTVIRNGSTSDASVAIAPGVPPPQASQQLQDTNDLLDKTDANLKRIEGKTLNEGQQDTLQQIKNYMDQARAAVKNQDTEHAYNLAKKANMLSADLLWH